ncbi:MAG: lytic murein transglycosylase B [Polaromonas sp.]|uniref:lytic murein transglycosylase B n=1 Tax=Polaromonas sp. TaxID=1869339 RepID=UPI00185B2DEF|nr:lytic murein transglycosylase B [Polaromonas sp.]MBA3592709.1 lytic murein transglycosylase B [Polaromonas sp.]
MITPPFPTLLAARCLVAPLLIAACAGGAWAAGQKDSKPRTSATRTVTSQEEVLRYADRPEAMAFADDLARRRDLDPQWVRQTLGQARHLPTVVRLMQPPARTFVKNWRVYRSRFIDPVRIGAGVRFWQDNQASLARAEAEYGVPAEIIVGIIGVETIYGRDTGKFRVLDALATLAFDFPASHPRARERTEFFRGEVEQFLTLQSRQRTDPFAALGSYAGAMGMPQFMPSSRNKYAVDFDGDGNIDLWNSPADVIGSVANYFKAFNWQPGMTTHYPVSFDNSRLDMDALMAPDILPTFSVASFTAKGAVLEGPALQHRGPLALVELLNGDPAKGGSAPMYVAGTENFYAITRYNWSSYYAMSVIELGREVATKRSSNSSSN